MLLYFHILMYKSLLVAVSCCSSQWSHGKKIIILKVKSSCVVSPFLYLKNILTFILLIFFVMEQSGFLFAKSHKMAFDWWDQKWLEGTNIWFLIISLIVCMFFTWHTAARWLCQKPLLNTPCRFLAGIWGRWSVGSAEQREPACRRSRQWVTDPDLPRHRTWTSRNHGWCRPGGRTGSVDSGKAQN